MELFMEIVMDILFEGTAEIVTCIPGICNDEKR